MQPSSEPTTEAGATGAPATTAKPSFGKRARARWARVQARVVRYFRDQDPRFWVAFTPALIIAALIYVRSPTTNFIFDEQEALLANPYVNGDKLSYWQAFERDFWGLPHTRSIGSYRPLPNLIWRPLWKLVESAWLPHWLNIVFHAVNASLLAVFARRLSDDRAFAWLAGATFLLAAVVTEAVTGVVGLADVLGGTGVLLALVALTTRWWVLPFAVVGGMAVGLLSKESAIVAVGLLPWVALVTAPALHPARPLRVVRTLLVSVACVGALIAYVEFRRKMFPVNLPAELQAPLPDSEPWLKRMLHEFMRWFAQPKLPADPMNNPLMNADFAHRAAGALRVYASGVVQVLVPWRLSGDYSYPQEPVPERLVFPASVAGGLLMALPPLIALGTWIASLVRERRARRAAPTSEAALVRVRVWPLVVLALGMMWVPLAYFPHSNIPVTLPTVRAERFWYLPVIGSSLLIALAFTKLDALSKRLGKPGLAIGLIAVFFGFQGTKARWHALDYTDDLVFWRATARSSPRSAKAQLNYGVMLGTRGRLEERLEVGYRAVLLAPKWPMAHVYHGDTLCRLRRPNDAWPHYVRGFELAPNDQNLIPLGLQCLWDQKAIESRHEELLELAADHPGTWLSFHARDIVANGKEHSGVDPKYRPRGYNEGPRE